MKAVETDFVRSDKRLAWGRDRNKGTNLSIIKGGMTGA